MYTPLEKAKHEIHQRWHDPVLRKRVEEYLGGNLPEVFREAPRAVLFRNIVTLNLEYLRFRELASKIGIAPLGVEYHADRFCTRSTDKLLLGKMRIFQGRDKNGAAITRCEKVFDLKANDNKAFHHIETAWGENLIDFHHALITEHGGQHELFDLSEWICSHSENAEEYYRRFLAVFACHGVLLENFATNSSETDFTSKVVRPSYDAVIAELGIEPLIVSIYTEEELTDISCWCYPDLVRGTVQNRYASVALRQQLMGLFTSYCSACTRHCCKEEEEVTILTNELKRLPIQRHLHQTAHHWQNDNSAGVAHIDIGDDCRFIETGRGCRLNLWTKPLDCLSYPVYPKVTFHGAGGKEITGMMVHRNCHAAEKMANDTQLLAVMRKLWEQELPGIDAHELREWFCPDDFWHQHNVIDCLDDSESL